MTQTICRSPMCDKSSECMRTSRKRLPCFSYYSLSPQLGHPHLSWFDESACTCGHSMDAFGTHLLQIHMVESAALPTMLCMMQSDTIYRIVVCAVMCVNTRFLLHSWGSWGTWGSSYIRASALIRMTCVDPKRVDLVTHTHALIVCVVQMLRNGKSVCGGCMRGDIFIRIAIEMYGGLLLKNFLRNCARLAFSSSPLN